MSLIQQIYATHCTFGTSAIERREGEMASRVLGYSARSSSWPQAELRKHFRTFERCLSYALPSDTPAEVKLERDARTSPKRLVFMPSLSGFQMLGQVSYRTWDTTGKRPGSYFGHLLIEQRGKEDPSWDILECLQLWGAPGWQIEDLPTFGYDLPSLNGLRGLWTALDDSAVVEPFRPAVNDDVLLKFLTSDDEPEFGTSMPGFIPARWQAMPKEQRGELFRQALRGYLEMAQRPRDNNVLLIIEPEMAVLFFYGIVRLLPEGKLREGLSFSTYEPTPERLSTMLAATHFHDSEQTDVKPDRYQRGFVLNTFQGGKATSIRQTHTYADLIVDQLISEGWGAVAGMFAAFQAGQGKTILDLAELVRAREIGGKMLDPDAQLPAGDWEESDFTRRYVCQQIATTLASPPGQSVEGTELEPLLRELLRAADGRALTIVRLLSGGQHAERCKGSLDYFTQRLPEAGYVTLLEMAAVSQERKVATLAYFVASHKRLPAGCEGLYEAALGSRRKSQEMQFAPLAIPLLKTLSSDLIRDLADRTAVEYRTALLVCLVEASVGHDAKSRIVQRLARDMNDDQLSEAIERMGANVANMSADARREIGLRFVQVLNGLHNVPSDFSLKLGWLKRAERLIADLEESRVDPSELGPTWSPIDRLHAWLRVPEIVATARTQSSQKSSGLGKLRGDSQGDVQYRVGKQVAEALAKALPHRAFSAGPTTHEKANAMFQVLLHLQATDLVSADWKTRAAFYLEYSQWHDSAGGVGRATSKKNLALISVGAGVGVAVVVLLGLLFLSGNDSPLARSDGDQSSEKTTNPPPKGTQGGAGSRNVSGNSTRNAAGNATSPTTPPGSTASNVASKPAINKAEEDLNSLPDSPPSDSKPPGGSVVDNGSNGASSGTTPVTPPPPTPMTVAPPPLNTVDAGNSNPAGDKGNPPDTTPSPMPNADSPPASPSATPRDYFVATAPNPPPWDLPLRVQVSELGGDASAAAPQERELRWELVAWSGVRLDFDTLILHGLQEAMEPWRIPPKDSTDSPISFDVVRLADRWGVRATSADDRIFDIAKFQVARDASKNLSKVVLEMKLNTVKESTKLRIQRQLFHCVVEVRDADGKPYFIALQPTVKSEPIPMTPEGIKEGNLRATTESADRIPRPESAMLGRLFLARGTLVYGEGQRMPFGEQGWQDAPGATEWPLPMPKDEPILADARIEIRVDKELAKLDVVFPKDTDAEVEKELKEVTGRLDRAIKAKGFFDAAHDPKRMSREENERRRRHRESVKEIVDILQVAEEPEPELKDVGPQPANEEKKKIRDAIIAENNSKLMKYQSWLDGLVKKLETQRGELKKQKDDVEKKSREYGSRYRTMTTEWRSKLKHAEVELYREVPLKDGQGKKIRVPVMLLPKSQANVNRKQADV